MIIKSKRTREKYAKAAAELDIMGKCLSNMKNTTDLLPAKEIDYLIKVYNKISYLRIILESQAAKDYAGKEMFGNMHISDIYFSPNKKYNKDYSSRYDEMIDLF